MENASRYMLDTSACIEILRGNPPPPEIRDRVCGISTVVEAELWAGVHHRGGKKERRKVELLIGVVEVDPFDSEAAKQTGVVLGDLAREGPAIGDFDSQIAGHALSCSATLVTKNLKHFQRVKGLQLLEWQASRDSV